MIDKKNVSKTTACIWGVITGGIGVFAYSPFDYWWVSILSASGLIWLATLPMRATALSGVFVWAVSYFAIGVNWVHVSMIQFGGVPEFVSYLAVLLLASYLALYPLLFAYLVQRFHLRNGWVLAAVWTGTEYLRGTVFTGFPWLQFGYSLIDSPFSGIAPIFGVEGLTFWIIAVSGYVVRITRDFAQKGFNPTACFGLCGLLLAAFLSQFLTWVKVDGQQTPKSISLIQANIEQRMKWDPNHFESTLNTYGRLIGEELGKHALIILPESAIPAHEQEIMPLLTQWHTDAEKAGTELIIGTLYQNHRGLFNSAVVLGNPVQPYRPDTPLRFNKHHLVPFGEYVPFGNLLDWLREVFVLPTNLSQGAFIQSPLLAGKRRFNMAICYEIVFGHQVQQNQQAAPADYLLTISNDAWFGDSIGPWQHFQMARMRALEIGKPLIRATNTGITAFVDAYGQVEKQAPQFETTVLNHQVRSYQGETPFVKMGQWGIYGFSLLILLLAIFRRKSKSVV